MQWSAIMVTYLPLCYFYLLPSCLLSSPTLWGLISCLRTHSSPLVQGEPCPLEPAPEAVPPWETISACPAPPQELYLLWNPTALAAACVLWGFWIPLIWPGGLACQGPSWAEGPHLVHVVSLHHSVWLLLIEKQQTGLGLLPEFTGGTGESSGFCRWFYHLVTTFRLALFLCSPLVLRNSLDQLEVCK